MKQIELSIYNETFILDVIGENEDTYILDTKGTSINIPAIEIPKNHESIKLI